MKKKTRKFASGGDILTGLGAGMLGYALYKKLKGEGKDEDSEYARKAKEFRDSKKNVEAVTETKEEPKTVSAGEKRAMAASKGRPELIPEGADEAVMRSDNYPTPKPKPTPKKVAPKAEKPTSQTFPLTKPTTAPKSDSKLELSKPGETKTSTSGIGPKNTFLTKERMDKAQDSMRRYREEQKKKQRGVDEIQYDTMGNPVMRKGGAVKKYASGGSVSSASKRADGIAQRGKTRGKVC